MDPQPILSTSGRPVDWVSLIQRALEAGADPRLPYSAHSECTPLAILVVLALGEGGAGGEEGPRTIPPWLPEVAR